MSDEEKVENAPEVESTPEATPEAPAENADASSEDKVDESANAPE